MCRIGIVAGYKNVPETNRRFLLHLLLLTAYADDGGQRDGWGVAAGSHILQKEADPYQYADRGWLTVKAPNGLPLLGHIRSASRNTGKGVALNSHPYRFEILNKPVVFAHNGLFQEALAVRRPPQEPDTDSYTAGLNLMNIIKEKTEGRFPNEAEMKNAVEEWSKHYILSTYVCIIGTDGEMYIIRKDESKTFYLAESDEGVIGSTSIRALENVLDIAERIKLLGRHPTIETVRPSTIVHIVSRKDRFAVSRIEASIAQRPVGILPKALSWSWSIGKGGKTAERKDTCSTDCSPPMITQASDQVNGRASDQVNDQVSDQVSDLKNIAGIDRVAAREYKDDSENIFGVAKLLVDLYPIRLSYIFALSDWYYAKHTNRSTGKFTYDVFSFIELDIVKRDRKSYAEIWNSVVDVEHETFFVDWLMRKINVFGVLLPHRTLRSLTHYEADLRNAYEKYLREGLGTGW